MKSNEEGQNVDDDKPVSGSKDTRTAPPKLRKNKRLEKRWGEKYYATVKEAVFTLRATPYMPPETPSQLRDEEDDCQPLYVCKQCSDCFRFLSSLEAHNSRRSWILGYWCHNCFFIDCSHTQKGQPPCFDCQAINRQQTASLRAKGLRKGRKMGSIKIFYNQCQFFAHLRGHNTTIVDMADVMLMPMPTDIDRESYAELEQLCETIMERMFLTRTHIMDWLRLHQLGKKWWRLLQTSSENDENPLADMLAATGGNRGGKKSAKYPLKPQKTTATGPGSPGSSVTYPSSSDTPSSISETIESVVAQSTWDETVPQTKVKNLEMPPLSSITFIDPLEPIEDDDNPCTTADIAFVDCGPAARTYPPDVAIVLPTKDKLKISPNGSTSCSSIVNVKPINVDSHPSSRVSDASLILKQCPANNNVHTTSSSIASPTSQRSFEPKISVKKFANERLKSSSAVPCQKNYSSVNNQRPQALRKLAPASNNRLAGAKTLLPSVIEIARAVETSKTGAGQASLTTLGTKILTVHTPKSTELSKIISQLPPDVINGKKIVFIGQDTERFTILPTNDTIGSSLGMIKIQSETDKGKIIQNVPTKKTPTVVSNIGSEQSMKIASDTSKKNPSADKIRSKMQQIYLDGKVIYQNGKKFIIRHARKPVPESTNLNTNSNNLKLQTVPKRVSLSSFLSKPQLSVTSCIPIAAKSSDTGTHKVIYPFAPSSFSSSSASSSSSPCPSLSPSPSTSEDPIGLKLKAPIKQNGNDFENVEKTTASRNFSESQSLKATSLSILPLRTHASEGVEYLSIQSNAAGKSYVDFLKATKELSWTQPAIDYKQQMLVNFRRLGAGRIKQQINHLIETNIEYSKMVGEAGDARLSDNLKIIADLENALKEVPLGSDQDQDIDQGSSVDDINEILFSLRETTEPPPICPTCNRSIKPESQTLGFSKGSVKSLGCCSCNNYVCHICNVFQGNISRFISHLDFHAKREPFTCPECFRKFATFHRLETHTWTTCFHPLARRWFKCRVCQFEGFLNMDSVTEHFILAHSKLKIACPECGIILKSRAALQKHHEEDHPQVTDTPRPVNLMVCDIGNCVVRLEKFRSHMDHHAAVINMIYYQCSFCSFNIKAVKRGREQIKSHLFNKHSEELAEVVSFQNVRSDHPKQSFASDYNSQSDYNPNTHDVSMSDLGSDKNDQGKEVTELKQGSEVLGSVQKNTEVITLDSILNNSQTDNQSSADYLDATLTKQTLKDGVECSIWSINLGQTESPESTNLGPDSLEIITTVQGPVDPPNDVTTKYSSSPKIFDVRSVTPDSYAELEGATKEQIDVIDREGESTLQSASGISREDDSEGFVEMKLLERPDETVASEGGTKDSLIIKMGEQSLPVKLPQVILINQAETNVNFAEILQSTLTASNTFVKLSDLTNLDDKPVTRSTVDLGKEVTDNKTDVPQTKKSSVPVIKTVYAFACPPEFEQCKKNTIDSTTVATLPGPLEVRPKLSTGGEKQMLSVSLLKSKNNSIEKIRNDIIEPNNSVSDTDVQVADVSQIMADTSGTCEEETEDPLLCDVPKPPPLARIPQHLLEVSQVKEEVEEEEPEDAKVTTPRSMSKSRRGMRRPWRIALNAPIHTSELIDFHCHLCGELINTSWSVLRNHFSSRHSEDYRLSIVTPRLLRMSSDFIAEGYKEVLGSKKRKSDGIVSSSKRRRRWNPKKHVEKHPLGPGLCVQQESVQDGEGNFVCKKCDRQCNDILSLRIHIGTNHRIKDHYLVCLECGENFVVEPSLQMHLKAFHRIQDPCAYMAQNTGYAKEITETIEDEANTGIANQCHVCMAVFEDKLAVDKHLRVHGMAFLNRKRIEAQNAARNPEKKSKIDKPDDSFAVADQKNEKLEHHRIGEMESVNGTARES